MTGVPRSGAPGCRGSPDTKRMLDSDLTFGIQPLQGLHLVPEPPAYPLSVSAAPTPAAPRSAKDLRRNSTLHTRLPLRGTSCISCLSRRDKDRSARLFLRSRAVAREHRNFHWRRPSAHVRARASSCAETPAPGHRSSSRAPVPGPEPVAMAAATALQPERLEHHCLLSVTGRAAEAPVQPEERIRWRSQAPAGEAVAVIGWPSGSDDLHQEQETDRVLLKASHHGFKHVEGLFLVGDQRILLAVSAKTNALLEVVHAQQMVFP